MLKLPLSDKDNWNRKIKIGKILKYKKRKKIK